MQQLSLAISLPMAGLFSTRIKQNPNRSSNIWLFWQKTIWIGNTWQKEMYTYNFKMVIGSNSLSPEAEQGLFPVLSLTQVQKPWSPRWRKAEKCFIKSLGTRPLVLRHPWLLRTVLSAVLNWTKLQPMWKTGAESHVMHGHPIGQKAIA
jgi:hypothetical protein